MARELSNEELDELLGAFALDAVDGDERQYVEEYLRRSPRARAVVAEYRETAALLAHTGTEAPPDLWERIERSVIEEAPQAGTTATAAVVPLGRRRSGGVRRIAATAAAAVAVLVVGALLVKVVQQDDRIDDLAREADRGSLLAAADAASRDPNAAEVRLASTDGSVVARVVYLPDGNGFLTESNLRRLSPEFTYQLWARVGPPQSAGIVSAGVLGPDPGVSAFRVRGPVREFLITEEQAPGVAGTVNPAVVSGPVD
jgi:anti-sigma-K factor RskA